MSRGAHRIGAIASRWGIGVALLLECLVLAQLSPYFFTASNLLNISLQVSITAIIAAGMTFVILTGGIDLSVGSLVAFAGIVGTGAIKLLGGAGGSIFVALVAGLALGAVSGLLAGVLITRFAMAPFVVTLALMTIWRGAAFVVTDGRPIWELPESFSVLGNGRLLGVPIPTLIMVAVFAVAFVVLRHTVFGRHVYAVGGNAEAARLAGIRTHAVLVAVYTVCGVLSAAAGILLASRMNSGQPNAGLMYELDVIAAVVVGGTSLSGGRGAIERTFLGAMFIAVLRNGLNLLNVNSYVQQVVVGVVIVLAVLLDRSRKE